MDKPTIEEIKRQIEKLEEYKKTIPKESMFGDKNHLVVDAQIKVLTGEIITRNDAYKMKDELGNMCQKVIKAFDYIDGQIETLVEE